MNKFLYTWELGANLGHLGAFLPIARVLAAAGHEVVLALRETRAAATLLADAGLPWVQAPYLVEQLGQTSPLSYPDILLRFGLGDPATLLGHVRSWTELFARCGTEVVVADHSPTALIAARARRLPVMTFGNGFFTPPRQRPLPALRPWQPLPPERLQEIEDRALAAINGVLRRFDAEPIEGVGDLFDVAEGSLLGFPEFDHYPERGPATYWGNVGSAGGGVVPVWPAVAGKRVFAYLRPAMQHFQPALDTLVACRQSVLMYCPDLPADTTQRLRALPHIRVESTPVDLDRATNEADAAVTYAPYATTVAFVQRGKPVLVVPGHLEQFLLAKRIEASGLGRMIHPEGSADGLPAALSAVLFEPGCGERARQFAAKYRDFTQDRVVGNIARRLVEIARIT